MNWVSMPHVGVACLGRNEAGEWGQPVTSPRQLHHTSGRGIGYVK